MWLKIVVGMIVKWRCCTMSNLVVGMITVEMEDDYNAEK